MELEKFYLDVVTENGAGLIGYSSRAKLAGLEFRPAVLLSWDADVEKSPVQKRATFAQLPVVDVENISWGKNPFGITAKWHRPRKPWREQILWDDDTTRVGWQVMAPHSPVTVTTRGANSFSGFGYVEILRITGAPWRLPLDVLRWGRFVSPEHNVTWIEWESREKTRRWLWADSDVPVENFSLGDHTVTWDSHALRFTNRRILRSGKIGKTIFSPMRHLNKFLPKWIKVMDETKWLARGILTGADNRDHLGWVIHETVKLR